MKNRNRKPGKLQKAMILLVITIAPAITSEATTWEECRTFVKKEKPTCIRKGDFLNLETCVCGKDNEDFQRNIMAEPRQVPPPIDYSACTEEDGILYCPQSIFDSRTVIQPPQS